MRSIILDSARLGSSVMISTALMSCAVWVDEPSAETMAATDPETGRIASALEPATQLFFATHQDDDLLFMNPDIHRAIQSGASVRTVYLSAGASTSDASPGGYCGDPPTMFCKVMRRQLGVKAAYATMAGYAEAAPWDCTYVYLAGKLAEICELADNPNVSLVFLRIYQDNFPELWRGTAVATAGANDDDPPSRYSDFAAQSYTPDQLVAVLSQLITEYQPARVGAQDSTGGNAGVNDYLSSGSYNDPTASALLDGDHKDHPYAALFAFEALRTSVVQAQFRMYRGYNVLWDRANLSQDEYADKWSAFYSYATLAESGVPLNPLAYSTVAPPATDYPPTWPETFAWWTARKYAIVRLKGLSGPIGWGASSSQQCLNVSGSTPVLSACVPGGASPPTWQVQADGTIRANDGRCLQVNATTPTSVSVGTCVGGANQKWVVMSNGTIRGAQRPSATGRGICLSVVSGSIVQEACAVENPAGGQPFDVALRQRWAIQFGAVSKRSYGTDFGDSEMGGSASYWRSLHLGNLDGTSQSDVCARLASGIRCGTNVSGSFSQKYLRSQSPNFADTDGSGSWLPAAYGSTIQFRDITGDGKADICGRWSDGVHCAVASGSSFGARSRWSTAFADSWPGFSSNEAYYGSIRLADMNGNGTADLCGRAVDGLWCARSLAPYLNSFATGSQASAEFSDAQGWNATSWGTTIQMGDINGDGKADVCGRKTDGVWCAVANAAGTAFEKFHPWSFRGYFSDQDGWQNDPSYYRSIRLADINGDGLADVCGRGTNGIFCGYSNGTSFDALLSLMPREYMDSQGWRFDKYGGTLEFSDLSGDGRPDVCARGAAGVLCGNAP